MRGGITYNEAHYLSPTERDIVSEIIKDNLETTKNKNAIFLTDFVNKKCIQNLVDRHLSNDYHGKTII